MIWKDVKGYENLYEVSENGDVRNKKNLVIISVAKCNSGYLKVHLYKNNKCTNKYVHRLVAEAFIPNPNKYRCVNHIDGDKLNNDKSNLVWCTHSDNNRHAYVERLKTVSDKMKTAMKANGAKRRKAVVQCDMDGAVIREWDSITQVHNVLGISQSNISRCCRGIQESANSFKWYFKEKA